MKQAGLTGKKVLVADELKFLLTEETGFLGRSTIKIFTAHTNNEVLNIHTREKVNLIVTQLDMSGMRSEELYTKIRTSRELSTVSTIIICKDTLDQRERANQCRPNAAFTMPVDIGLLHIKMQHLLNIAPRKSHRSVVALAIQGRFGKGSLTFWTENISPSGMLISTEQLLSKGEAVFFSFFLPNGTHASGYGEVVRVVKTVSRPQTFLYGIKFTKIDPAVSALFAETMTKNESQA